GFANDGMLTVGALYIVVAGLRETGGLEIMGSWMLGQVKSETGIIRRMSVTIPILSAFLNNTPIVAMFIPVLSNWCKKNRVSVSRLLIPLSYLSILGGTCTLIGTSTNLVVNGLMVEKWKADPQAFASLHSLSLFELSLVGIPYALIGGFYLYFIGRRLLPDRREFMEEIGRSRREYLVNMEVAPGCALIGQSVEQAGLRHLPGLFLVEIVRRGAIIAPVRPDETLTERDLLTFTGIVSTIVDLEKIPGLNALSDRPFEQDLRKRQENMMCEAVVSNTSPLIGKTVRDSDFRARYNAAIVAVHRGGERLAGKVGDIMLRAGDTLLIQTGPHFIRANRNNSDFYLVGGVEDSRPVRHQKAVLSLALVGLLVLLLATDHIPIVFAAFLVAGLMVATRCVFFSDARKSIDWQTLVTIAAAFGLGKALVNSGVVHLVTGWMTATIGQMGPVMMLAGIYLLTSTFTEVITNNAAAALVFPFALSLAQQMGV
ncbi:MAG TPA: SLC13 family permease, partial [Candidatus Glassbacteria bacterium]|nr:SLC13 family permease [Candidatus Glassbacteria bacterium]